MASSGKQAVDWQMQNMDTGEFLHPPYPMDEGGLRISLGGNFVTQDRFGFQDAIVQWTGGKVKTLTFSSVLYAADRTDNIVAEMRKFEKLAIKDNDLGRPPIVIFSHGNYLTETVFVESVDPDIPPIRPDNQPREVILNFALLKYVPFSQSQIDPTKAKKESYFLVASAAEASYEQIARRYYGNPLLGDLLRKRHPSMPMQPTVGQKISIPARSIILQEVVEPAFHALSLTNAEAVANFETVLEERNTRKVVLI